MWGKRSLRTRILTIVAALTALTVGGGLASLWYSYQTNSFLKTVVEDNLAALQAADHLERALVMQKGYLTYFFQDGDLKWLADLDQRHQEFGDWLNRSRQRARSEEESGVLKQIETQYAELTRLRERVVDLYKSGRRQAGFEIHQTARSHFFRIQELTQLFRRGREEQLNRARQELSARARYLTGLALAALPSAAFLGALLAFMLIRQVLVPIRQLAQETDPATAAESDVNEVQALSHGVRSLIEDVGQARSELEVSREHLIEAAKLASVGKLAAATAHSIRNPLTSVKMRLFSLERSLRLSDRNREDFYVISREIRHIDNIVRNFLEFSRRPELRVRPVSPSEIVDGAIDLMRDRLELSQVDLELKRSHRLPAIQADPEQLKDALVNLLTNACEAVGPGGRIVVEETRKKVEQLGLQAIIRVSDNGPGVPDALRGRIFHPLFTTKDEGTGLGLSIALRIIGEHGGRLELEPSTGQGASFVVTLPIKEE